jgi:hypothetical protein
MADELRVRGRMASWGHLVFKLDGERYYGFTGLSFGDKRERVAGYGMGRHHAPRGVSEGKYTTEVLKVTGFVESVQALRKALAAKSEDGKSYGNVAFEGELQYAMPGKDPIQVEFLECYWQTSTTSNEENPDPLKEDFEVFVTYILRDGFSLFDQTEGAL